MQLHTHDPRRSTRAAPPQILPSTEPKTGPLRILAWVDRYPPFPGAMAGGEWALHGMLAPLAARGHEVRVCTPCAPHGPALDLDGVLVEHDDMAPNRLDDCDVLVSHLLWTKHAVNAAARGGTPLVYLFHNDFTIPHWRLTTDNVTALVYNTHWLEASILHKHAHWADVPGIVVRPPVDLDAYRVDSPGWDREHVTLVNPNAEKGSGMLYKLADARRDLSFLAVEGAYGHQVRPQRRHRNVAWQPQTPRMRDDVYARTRILLVPSQYESFGRVAVEACAAGAAVIASSTPGLHEALGSAGLFADLKNPTAWLAWLDALGDREVYDTAVRAGLERAAQLAQESVRELDALENLIRLAANAEPVPSRAMAPAYDPHRRHARSVEVSGPAESPAPETGAPAVPSGAGERERLAQAGITDPGALAMADRMDEAAAEQHEAAGVEAAMAAERWSDGTGETMEAIEVVEGETAELTGDGTGVALPPLGQGSPVIVEQEVLERAAAAPSALGLATADDVRAALDMDTQQGAGADGETTGGDTGAPAEGPQGDALASEPGETGDGPSSQDADRPSPEPAPTTTGDASGEVALPAHPEAEPTDPDRPALVDLVPANATGDDGIVAWINAGGLTEAEVYDRAEAAEYVELRRKGKRRKAVMEAVGPILYIEE